MGDQVTRSIGSACQATLGISVNYARSLLKEIEPGDFAHMPMPGFNHPAFCYGHLSLYPNTWFEFIGRPDACIELPFDPGIYSKGAECVEQDGRYASMEVITSSFFQGHERMLEILPGIEPEVFDKAIPEESRYRDFFGTVGNAINFMTGAHIMMHLGQVSMWRRAMGLPPCL